MHIPVRRMFMSMCLGVSPSSNSIEDGAGVFVLLSTAEAVLLFVAGRDFLVILFREGRQVNFKTLNNMSIVSINSAPLPHLTYFVFQAAPQDVLWGLATSIFVAHSLAAPGRAGTLCFGGTNEKTAHN